MTPRASTANVLRGMARVIILGMIHTRGGVSIPLWVCTAQYHATRSTTDASRSIYDAALLWHVESWMHEVERPNTSHDIIRGIDTPEMTLGRHLIESMDS